MMTKTMANLEDNPEYLKYLAEEKAKAMGYNSAEERSVEMQGKNLADIIGVSPSGLSRAAKNDHRCGYGDYRVSKWAVRKNGRIDCYRVPLNIYKDLKEDEQEPSQPSRNGHQRENPESEGAESTQPAQDEVNETQVERFETPDTENSEQKREPEDTAVEQKSTEDSEDSEQEEKQEESSTEKIEEFINQFKDQANEGGINTQVSLLPQGENYTQPVAAGSLAWTVNTLISSDTRNSKIILYLLSAGVGGLAGYKATDDSAGGGLGGVVVGLLLAFLGDVASRQSEAVNGQISDAINRKARSLGAPSSNSSSNGQSLGAPVDETIIDSQQSGASNSQMKPVNLQGQSGYANQQNEGRSNAR